MCCVYGTFLVGGQGTRRRGRPPNHTPTNYTTTPSPNESTQNRQDVATSVLLAAKDTDFGGYTVRVVCVRDDARLCGWCMLDPTQSLCAHPNPSPILFNRQRNKTQGPIAGLITIGALIVVLAPPLKTQEADE